MEDELQVERCGRHYLLRREQWKGKTAEISACDELLEEVKKYCWTLRGSKEHPYLSTKVNHRIIYLHTFVFRWLYGDEQYAIMAKGMVIDHLDNNGLNCSFDNLCLSTDTDNVIKGRGIDNGVKLGKDPAYIINVFYRHDQGLHQMQIAFNRAEFIYDGRTVARMYLAYSNHGTMTSDRYYLVNCLRDDIIPDYVRLRENMVRYEFAVELQNVPENWYIIEQDDHIYYRFNSDAGNHSINVVKTELEMIPWNEIREKMKKEEKRLEETPAGNTDI